MKLSRRRARIMRCTHRRRRIARLIWRWCNCPSYWRAPKTPQRRRLLALRALQRRGHRPRQVDLRNALKGI